MEGWVSIHREILEHWIFENPVNLKRWILILLNVNHRSIKVQIGNEFYTCNPGESFKSIENWRNLFGCSKRTAINFFKLLEEDNMVNRSTMGKGNRRKHLLTVVNWEKYQQSGNSNLGNLRNNQEIPVIQVKKKRNGNPILNPKVTPNNNDIINRYKKWAEDSDKDIYKAFVEWFLYQGFNKVLKLEDQINEDAFTKIYEITLGNGRTKNELIKEKIIAMEAKADLLTKYSSFSRTLQNWVNR